jgi:hypothetical protein
LGIREAKLSVVYCHQIPPGQNHSSIHSMHNLSTPTSIYHQCHGNEFIFAVEASACGA